MSPVKMGNGDVTAEQEAAAKAERKRLKKLAKAKAALAEAASTNGVANGNINGETKGVSSDDWMLTKKEKKKRKEELAAAAAANESMDMQNNVKEKKKAKKRKLEKENGAEAKIDWAQEVDQVLPLNGDSGKKKKKEGDEPEKKKKKKEKAQHLETPKEQVVEEVKEKGPFKKIFYKPTKATLSIPDEQVKAFQEKHKMNLTGRLSEIYKPIENFADFCTDAKIMSVVKDFDKPTPIQSQCWPIIGSGRDIIGIAETGSGKTLAFSLPALEHMLYRYDHPVPGLPPNPIMLVLSPTRELAMQSQEVMEKAGKECEIRSVCCYGGVPKWQQRQALRWGTEVVVATPGRLKDLVNMGCLNLKGVSYLVLDEADRMLDQGFEDDIREIIGMTHPERQTCLFSATWPEAIRQLAREFLTDPIKVTIGTDDLTANTRIKQVVEVIDERDKPEKLMKCLEKYNNADTKNRMIVFVLKKMDAGEVENELWNKGYNVVSIHGDKTQWERTNALEKFKRGTANVLVATDVAARGLDIPDVEAVINFSFPLTIEDYVHRIGRTGRAGKEGIAHSLFTQQDYKLAGCLVKVLKDAGQEVPPEMLKFDLRIRGKMFDKFFNKDGTNSAPVQCYRCNDTGHISRDCPQGGGGGGFRGRGGGRGFGGRGGGGRGGGGGEGCFKCGEQGHFSRECPKGGGGGRGGGFRGRGGRGRF